MADAPTPLVDGNLVLDGVVHGFFTREGGVSQGLYAGLNVGVGSSDDRSHVMQNRARAMRALDMPAETLAMLYQIHSVDAVAVEAVFDPNNRPKADGMVTDRPGIVLGISTADCAPVLFADTGVQIVGACHAGWGGAFKGVVAATVDLMERLGARRDRIAAVLGPCIHQVSYEVGPEFHALFVASDASNERYFVSSDREGHYCFDLPGYVLDRIAATGVATVGHVAANTYADPARFYSYRRATHRDERNRTGAIDYGRLLSAVALKE